MRAEHPGGAMVAIVTGNPVVGEALEALLQGLGYRARFEAAPPHAARRTARSQGAELLVLGPGLTPCRRKAVLARARGRAPVAGAVPVLELSGTDPPSEASALRVRWPCRAEELARAIDAALEAGASYGRA